MKNYIYLIKNMGLLTLSQFGTKLLSFFLVPLYTSVLTTSEYGTYDLLNTTISLLIPILTVNIVDSALRFALDDHLDKKEVFSITLKYLVIGIFIFLVLMLGNHIFNILPSFRTYELYFILLLITTAISGVLSNFARGLERIFDVSVSSLLSSAAIIILNVLFLVTLKMGIDGYFLATILGVSVQIIYLIISLRVWRYIGIAKDKVLENEMITYSKPLILNSISWWINNASDRYIVIWLCGMSVNGIYSVAYKIPSILNIFQTIFSQAWTLSAVKDFDPEDSDGFFSKMYNFYNFSMVLVCSALVLSTKFLAKMLYANEFYEAWQYVPFLLIAIVFGSLSGYIGGIFSATKESKIFGQSTAIGAIINIILNIILVYFIGAIGAAIATAISFYIVWLIRMRHLKQLIKLKLHLGRDYLVYGLLLLQTVLLLLFPENLILYVIELLIFVVILVSFTSEIKGIISRFVR